MRLEDVRFFGGGVFVEVFRLADLADFFFFAPVDRFGIRKFPHAEKQN
jgi:hypothetical protein